MTDHLCHKELAQLLRIRVRCRSGFRMLGKTYRENSGATIPPSNDSALYLLESGMFLSPAVVLDSRTRMVSLTKSTSSHLRARASRFDRMPVSRTNTVRVFFKDRSICFDELKTP